MLFDTEEVEDQMFRNPTLANHGWQRAFYKPNGQQSTFGKIASTALPVIGGAVGGIIGGPAGIGIGAKLGSVATKGINSAARNSTEGTDTFDMIDLSKSSAQSDIAPAIAGIGGAALSMGGPDAMKKIGMNADQITKFQSRQPQMIESGAMSLGGAMSSGNPFANSSNPYRNFADGGLAGPGSVPPGTLPKKVRKEVDQTKKFYNDYYASDEFRNRVIENGATHPATERINSMRGIAETSVEVLGNEQMDKFTHPMSSGFAQPQNKKIVLRDGIENSAEVLAHEYSHVSDPSTTAQAISSMPMTIDHKRASEVNIDVDGASFVEYVGKPTEQRARLFDIHKKAQDYNINNITNGEKFDRAKFDALEGYGPIQDLKLIHTDEQIINMLNTVASDRKAVPGRFSDGGLAEGPGDKSKAKSDNTRVKKPFNTMAYTPNYAGNSQMVDWTKNANMAKVEADEAAKNKLELERTRGYSTGTGKTEPVYPEVMLFPATPAIRGIGKAANLAVDALNPVGGMGMKAKALKTENIDNDIAAVLKEIRDKKPHMVDRLSYSTAEHTIEDARLPRTDFIPKTENIDNDIAALTLMKDRYSKRISPEDMQNVTDRLQDLHSTKYLRGEFTDNIKGRGYNPTLKDLSINTVNNLKSLVRPDGEIIGTMTLNENFVGASKVKKGFMGMYDKDNRVGEALYRGVSKGLKETTGTGLKTAKGFVQTSFTDADGVKVVRARAEDFWNKLLDKGYAVVTPQGHYEIIKTVGGLAVGETIRRDMSSEPENTFAYGGLAAGPSYGTSGKKKKKAAASKKQPKASYSDGGNPMSGPVVIHDESDKTTEDLAMIDIKTGEHFGSMRYGERIFDQTATKKIDSMVRRAASDPKHRTPKNLANLGNFVYKETLTHKDMKDGPVGFYDGGLPSGPGGVPQKGDKVIKVGPNQYVSQAGVSGDSATIYTVRDGNFIDTGKKMPVKYFQRDGGKIPAVQTQDGRSIDLSSGKDYQNFQGLESGLGRYNQNSGNVSSADDLLRRSAGRDVKPGVGAVMSDTFGRPMDYANPDTEPPATLFGGTFDDVVIRGRRPTDPMGTMSPSRPSSKTPPPPSIERTVLPDIKPLSRTGGYTPPSMPMPKIPGADEVGRILDSRTPPAAEAAWRPDPTNALLYGLKAGVAASMTRPLPEYELPGEYVSNMMDMKNRASGGMGSMEENRLIDTASRGLSVANSGGRTPYAAAATALGAQRQFNDTVLGIGALDQRVRAANQSAYTGIVADFANRDAANFQLRYNQTDATNQALMQAAGENLDAIGADIDYQKMWANPDSPFVKMLMNSQKGEKRYEDRNTTLGQTPLSISIPLPRRTGTSTDILLKK